MGLQIILSGVDASALNLGKVPSTNLFFERSGIVDTTTVNAINTMFNSLIEAGLWDLIYYLYPYGGTTAAKQKVNLKNAEAQYDLTFVNDTTGAHISLGFQPSSANQTYGDCPFIFDGIADLHIGCYNTSAEATGGSASSALIAVGHGTESDIRIRLSRNVLGRTYLQMGYSGGATAVQADVSYDRAKKGFLLGSRLGSSVVLYDNGDVLASGTDSTTFTPPTTTTVIGARYPESGTASQRWYSSAAQGLITIGKALTAQQVSDYSDIVLAYQTALSRQ